MGSGTGAGYPGLQGAQGVSGARVGTGASGSGLNALLGSRQLGPPGTTNTVPGARQRAVAQATSRGALNNQIVPTIVSGVLGLVGSWFGPVGSMVGEEIGSYTGVPTGEPHDYGAKFGGKAGSSYGTMIGQYLGNLVGLGTIGGMLGGAAGGKYGSQVAARAPANPGRYGVTRY